MGGWCGAADVVLVRVWLQCVWLCNVHVGGLKRLTIIGRGARVWAPTRPFFIFQPASGAWRVRAGGAPSRPRSQARSALSPALSLPYTVVSAHRLRLGMAGAFDCASFL